MNTIQLRDIEDFCREFKLGENLRKKTFLITGATGLIGSTLCYCISKLSKEQDLGIRILCPVREEGKANDMFNGLSGIYTFRHNISELLNSYQGNIDYIVHCASPTSSKYMTTKPVETYTFMIESTLELLRYTRVHPIESMVYVSSLEYYGQVLENTLIIEDSLGYVDPKSARSSYPMGKRAAEFACTAYFEEYSVPVKIARLTQTFGPGVSRNDNRVFAQFSRAAINGENIVLKSSGKSSKPYCYTTDTINGILTILLCGENGEAYNVSNDATYISINDMAELVKKEFNPSIHIIYDFDPNFGYAADTFLKLTSAKLQKLGWRPKFGLIEMYRRLIEYFKSNE
ncbi:dTDP-glucose 4,6-dehydratase [Segatella buccae]|uniref:dTDP-glucose 4,6-dehydratase n=1 Tax=Segatella buccae TaxID=28126 RepID=A0AAQ1UNE0_9BACT|nr:NAD-dependent epimerase/dehydratase family protein [Segatella buccae]SUB96680.1 dTDP-glucose 4,6-dehydratase [Segatella buccae]